jgi:hypothetical protein
MIVFDLKCANDHVFEVWFASSEAYEDQRHRGLVACAFCGSTDVTKAVMAPRLNAKGNQQAASSEATSVAEVAAHPAPVAVSNAPAPPDIAKMRAVLTALAQAQTKALEQSTWVGESFADRARAMHYGEEDHADRGRRRRRPVTVPGHPAQGAELGCTANLRCVDTPRWLNTPVARP